MTWKAMNSVVASRETRNVSAYRKAIAEITQKRVAELVEVAPATLNDFNDTVERVCLVLAAAGLKVVGVNDLTVTPEEYRYLLKQQIRHAERELAELPDTRPGDL